MTRNEGVNISEAPAGHRRPVKPPPAPPLAQGVTGNANEKKAGTKRQQRRRERLKEQDIKEVTAKLGPVERAMLDESRAIRGGVDGPYTVTIRLMFLPSLDLFHRLRSKHGSLKSGLPDWRVGWP